MSIVVYFDSMNPAGGIERVISSHVKYLAKQDEVVLITNDNKPSFYELPSNIKKESLGLNFNLDMNSRLKRVCQVFFYFIIAVFKLRKKIKKIEPDLIYVATPLNLFKIYLTSFDLNNVIVTEHASFMAYNKVYKKIVKHLYKRVKLLTVPTIDDSNLYRSLDIQNEYLPNPLPFYPTTESTLENKTILNIGRLTSDKRQKLLVEICNKSMMRSLGWRLKIIGEGEKKDELNELINHLNMSDIVKIFPNTKEIEREYKNSSIFCLSSVAEGFGLVLAEAMANGVPCISFNCPSGPKDIITNLINGYLIEEGDINDYIRRLNNLMLSFELRQKLGNRAKLDISKFEEEVIGKNLIELIKR